MTEPDSAPTPSDSTGSGKLGRPPRFVVLVALAVVAVAAGWSAVWYFGTQKADAMITAWLADEAARGRTYACGERSVGGYPFRVEVRCTEPSVDIADAKPHVRASASGFRAVAQVWNLTHVIYEIDGPVRIEGGNKRRPAFAVDTDWDLLQGSLRAPGGQIARGDLAITGFTAMPDPAVGGPGGGATVTASRVGIHGRKADTAPDAHDVDIAVDTIDLVVTPDGMGPSDAVDLSFVGRLGALPYPPPRDPEAFLAAWRANGGSVEVGKLSATQGETELRAEGTLTPDGAGRPEGSVTIKLAGPDLTTPGSAGAFGGLAPVMALALRLAGRPDDIEGRTAVSGTIEMRDGKVFLGPMPIAELPKIF
ncbi:DUF2125 domain-containing protein [Microbaculum marinisediminis]|uniref:DUF2125 domain-containing protein n=1 Tax=Microbaculum marinisediminis TaxID=2931392 RepID=A0AAW5QZD1_9HYPH|nr:DUF2125 domain-containing protein [Microbaculum sp. A6E488]MCT8972385.1 DUF2125 domain-containing protein [Microbaculum sp. A6E488]